MYTMNNLMNQFLFNFIEWTKFLLLVFLVLRTSRFRCQQLIDNHDAISELALLQMSRPST